MLGPSAGSILLNNGAMDPLDSAHSRRPFAYLSLEIKAVLFKAAQTTVVLYARNNPNSLSLNLPSFYPRNRAAS